MATVLLAGAFGQGNPGDEALLEAFRRHLHPFDVVATSMSPDVTEQAHGCVAVPSWDVREVARAAARSDGVVFAGGTVFKLLHPSAERPPLDLLRKALVLAAGARALGRSVAMVGVGAGELHGAMARVLTRSVVRRADLLIVRDEESARILAGMGVRPPFRVGADPSWTIFDRDGDAPRPPSDAVVVALSHLADDGTLAGRLAETVDRIADGGRPVQLHPWQPGAGRGRDGSLAEAIAARARADVEILPPPADLHDARRTFASASVVVGFRFHSLVAAAAAGASFVAVDHEAKLGALARRLDQPRVDVRADAATLAGTVLRTADAPPPSRTAIDAEVEAARETFRLLDLVLTGGRSEDTSPMQLDGLPLEPLP